MQRRTVVYSGHVQGVGFRYTTQGVARRFTVSGYVRNLPDGRVELVAEGTPDELDRFIAAVHEQMRSFIHQAKVDTMPATGEFDGEFSIRR